MRLLIALPLLLLLVLFALSNTAPVRLGSGPPITRWNCRSRWRCSAPWRSPSWLGGPLVWLSELAQRRRARQAEQAVRLLEAQVQELKARLPQPPSAAMTAVQVKICGINDPVAFDTAIAAGADWVGFNFFPPSPRYVTPAQAAALSARSPGGPPRVGLFVDPTPDAIAATLDTVRLDILQLYGALDLPALRTRFGLPIWRACRHRAPPTCPPMPAVPIGCCGSQAAARGDAAGRQRRAVRLVAAARLDGPGAWILAGGLTADNVAEAIRVTGAPRWMCPRG